MREMTTELCVISFSSFFVFICANRMQFVGLTFEPADFAELPGFVSNLFSFFCIFSVLFLLAIRKQNWLRNEIDTHAAG